MLKRLKALYYKIAYAVADCYKFEKGLKDMARAIPVLQARAWIWYVIVHSELSEAEAAKVYDMCSKLHIKKFTRRKAKQITKMIMEIANCGYPADTIVLALAAACFENNYVRAQKLDL